MLIRVLVISLISITALAASVLLSKLPVGNEAIIWELPRATGMTVGQIILLGADVPPKNYTIEVKTRAKNSNLLPESQASLTLTAFSSSGGAAEAQAQLRYVHDTRIIIPTDADFEAVKVWYTP
jgi:hypothetical protein